MQGLIPARAAIVVHGVSHFAWYVLHQRAVQMDVQELRAVANGQYGFAVRERVIEQQVIGVLAALIRICVLCVTCAAKAARLHVSEHTAKFHVASIMTKLGAASRTEAVTLAARRGLLIL